LFYLHFCAEFVIGDFGMGLGVLGVGVKGVGGGYLGLAVAGRACMVLLIFLLFELLFDFGDG
jgi:hypothetical protein